MVDYRSAAKIDQRQGYEWIISAGDFGFRIAHHLDHALVMRQHWHLSLQVEGEWKVAGGCIRSVGGRHSGSSPAVAC